MINQTIEQNKQTAVGVLNTSIGSANIGDQVIVEACLREIRALLPYAHLIHFSSHDPFFRHALRLQRRVAINFLCGTNCFSSSMFPSPSWAVNPIVTRLMKKVVPIGVGWGAYQGKVTKYARSIYRTALIQDGFISVRDNYTKAKLEECGFSNILTTGCPTIWTLTANHCSEIPTQKSSDVVFTFTDYAQDDQNDLQTLSTLSEQYDVTYIWLQGSRDSVYLQNLQSRYPRIFEKLRLRIIPPSLHHYDDFLRSKNVDYVGTRLHAGIRALQHKRRTIIIAVDNRAEEKRKDFGLPVLPRDQVDRLSEMIASNWSTRIELPMEEITKFRSWMKETSAIPRLTLPLSTDEYCHYSEQNPKTVSN